MSRTIAIAGLGAAARQIHLPAYRRAGLEVVAGCDPALPDGFDFPIFENVDQLLDKVTPDVLAVVAPPHHHYEICRSGLEAGCHLFCEKPFMPELAPAREIVALASEVGRQVVVNQQYRFMEIHQAAHQLIDSPDFGELLFLEARQTFRRTSHTEAGWRGQDPRRTCQEFGIHVLDLCRYFFRAEPTSILARMPKPTDQAPAEREGADNLNLILLEFPGDRTAQITLDRLTRGRHRYLDLRLDGTASAFESRVGGGIGLSLGIRGGTRRPYVDLDISLGGRARLYDGERHRTIARDPLDIFSRATYQLLERFLAALDAGTTPPCTGSDNLGTLALMLAAYESDESGRRISLPPEPLSSSPT